MALPITNSAPVLAPTSTSTARTFHPLRRLTFVPSLSSSSGRTLHLTSAKKQQQEFSSITGKFGGKNRRRLSPATTTTKDDDDDVPTIETVGPESSKMGSGASAGGATAAADGYFLPELPGDKPDFWEGEQWDSLGFFLQYLWAFSFVFALIACGIAVATYNEGAADFKDTPVYKEAIGSRELLDEQPDAGPDVFESNPTEVAPSLN